MITQFIKSREVLLVLAIAGVVALVSTRFPGFAAPGNAANIFNDTSILIMLALGQMVVILTRCIDLSVASNLALSGMVVALINTVVPGLPIPILLLIAISLGMVMGAHSGVEAGYSANCGDAWHADHLPRHHLPDFQRRVDQCP